MYQQVMNDKEVYHWDEEVVSLVKTFGTKF